LRLSDLKPGETITQDLFPPNFATTAAHAVEKITEPTEKAEQHILLALYDQVRSKDGMGDRMAMRREAMHNAQRALLHIDFSEDVVLKARISLLALQVQVVVSSEMNYGNPRIMFQELSKELPNIRQRTLDNLPLIEPTSAYSFTCRMVLIYGNTLLALSTVLMYRRGILERFLPEFKEWELFLQSTMEVARGLWIQLKEAEGIAFDLNTLNEEVVTFMYKFQKIWPTIIELDMAADPHISSH
jgi:hypothetical protein